MAAENLPAFMDFKGRFKKKINWKMDPKKSH